MSRTVFDEAPGLGELLMAAIKAGLIKVSPLYLEMFSDLLSQPAGVSVVEADDAVLTQREQEILQLLRRGLSNQAISESTGVALSTIKWHLKNIFAKLGVSTRAEAIVHSDYLESAVRTR